MIINKCLNIWFAGFVSILLLSGCTADQSNYRQWEVYKGGPEANNYSALDQINRTNVKDLEIAWTFYPNDEPEGFKVWKYECNPIVVNGIMYLTSAWRKLYALDATSGAEIWQFDPLEGNRGGGVLRGVTFYDDGINGRIFVSARNRLYAVDAKTGEAISTFGDQGKITLDIKQDRENPGSVSLSTPGIIYRDLIIIGAVVSEAAGAAAPGDVRAFNAHTGELVWTFHTIPKPGAFGHDTWPQDAYQYIGGANNWAGMSLDEERGIVFVPTGSPTYDYYAGDRIGTNLFANSLIALNALTGERLWHFQTIHHDLWDYDLPTAPNLVTINVDGEKIDAVAQPTKMGFLYVLDRESGEPVFPVEERTVATSNISGEKSWPTQPFPLKPTSFARQTITEDDAMDYGDGSHQYLKEIIRELNFKGLFTPLSTSTQAMFPGSRGGAEWGGGAYDPATGILYINANELPELGRIELYQEFDSEIKTLFEAGKEAYEKLCASCHGDDKQGVAAMPALKDVTERLTKDEIIDVIKNGNGVMPAFSNTLINSEAEILAFLADTGKTSRVEIVQNNDSSASYRNVANKQLLLDSLERPVIKPPWGTLNAIDLNTAEYKWRVPLGSDPKYQIEGEPLTGAENYGGPVVTAGGIVLIAATMDNMFRAFDTETGEIIWQTKLPGNGLANPAVYEIDNRQYVAIAVSVGEFLDHHRCAMVVFALPERIH